MPATSIGSSTASRRARSADRCHWTIHRDDPVLHPMVPTERQPSMTDTDLRTTRQIVGRDDVNDLEEILMLGPPPADEVVREIAAAGASRFTWDYERPRPALAKLYEKAKTSQWNGSTDLDWAPDVDPERSAGASSRAPRDAVLPAAGQGRPAGPHFGWTKKWPSSASRYQNAASQPVPPRRAGRAVCTASMCEHGAVDRRQVLRVHPGDGRGPPRRGVRPLPRREADGPLPHQRQPDVAARRHPRRWPLGHHLPRHADHGRGPRARRLRRSAQP